MTDLNVKTVSTLDNAELDLLIKILHQEKDKRASLEREKLVNAFLNAWSNLRENGINVAAYEEDDAYIELNNQDCFYFH